MHDKEMNERLHQSTEAEKDMDDACHERWFVYKPVPYDIIEAQEVFLIGRPKGESYTTVNSRQLF